MVRSVSIDSTPHEMGDQQLDRGEISKEQAPSRDDDDDWERKESIFPASRCYY